MLLALRYFNKIFHMPNPGLILKPGIKERGVDLGIQPLSFLSCQDCMASDLVIGFHPFL